MATTVGPSSPSRIDEIPGPCRRPGISPIAEPHRLCDDSHDVRTVLIDDHAGFRGFARQLLEAGGSRSSARHKTVPRPWPRSRSCVPILSQPDIVLPDTDGFSVAERLVENGDGPAVVLTSSREAADFGARLQRSHARGFIHKDQLSGPALAMFAERL